MTALDVLIEEDLAGRAQRLGEQFRSGIRSLRSPLVKEVRGRGLFNAIVIDESASSRGRTAWQFCLLLKSRGVLAKPTHVNMCVGLPRNGEEMLTDYLSQSIRFAPPLVISEEDLQNAIGVIRQALIDLDQVRWIDPSCYSTDRPADAFFISFSQLEEIPGEVESEKGFRDELSN